MNGGRIAGRDHEWEQDALTVPVAVFHSMGIYDNPDKTNTMLCTPGFIWTKWGKTAYKQRATVEGETFM